MTKRRPLAADVIRDTPEPRRLLRKFRLDDLDKIREELLLVWHENNELRAKVLELEGKIELLTKARDELLLAR